MQAHGRTDDVWNFDAQSDPPTVPPSLMSHMSPTIPGNGIDPAFSHSGSAVESHQQSPSDYVSGSLYSPTISPGLTEEYPHSMDWSASHANHEITAPGNAYMTPYPSSHYPGTGGSGYVQQSAYNPHAPVTGDAYFYGPVAGDCVAGPPPETGMSFRAFAEPGEHDYVPNSQRSNASAAYDQGPSQHADFGTPSEDALDLSASYNSIPQNYNVPESNGCMAALGAVASEVGRSLRSRHTRSARSHGDHAPLACGIDGCQKLFHGKYKSGNRTRHVNRLHLSTEPLLCRSCGAPFGRSDARKKHELRLHQMIFSTGSKNNSVTPPSVGGELDGTAITPYAFNL